MDDPREQLGCAIREGLPSGPDDALMRLLYEFDVLAGSSQLHDELVEKMYDRQLATYRGVLERGIAVRGFRVGVAVDTLAMTLVALEDWYRPHIVAGNSRTTGGDRRGRDARRGRAARRRSGPMSERWWGRGRGLPADAYEAWRRSLAEVPGPPARILAWARTPVGFGVGSPAVLSVGDETGFDHLGWHEIEHGGWNAETRRLSWICYPAADGRSRRGFVELVEPARLPELFRERVAVVLDRYVGLAEGGGVTGLMLVVIWPARPTRSAGTSRRFAAPTGGARPARAEAEQILAMVRGEYDTTPTGW